MTYKGFVLVATHMEILWGNKAKAHYLQKMNHDNILC